VSETAILLKREDGYSLRWFTPKVEVDLCGHATLASAHVLWEERHVKPDETIQFHTRSGVLKAVRQEYILELDFPLIPEEPAAAPAGLAEALGVSIEYVGKGRFVDAAYRSQGLGRSLMEQIVNTRRCGR